MNTRRIGRNDPCPCGSGKKYKHCCLRRDQARRSTAPAGRVQADAGDDRVAGLALLQSEVDSLRPHLDPEEIQKLEQALEDVREAAMYEALGPEIEAAGQALEAHRAAFEAMLADGEAAVNRAERLFAQERFAPLRFTAEDVYRAFEVVGYPLRQETEAGRNAAIIDAAILHLADEQVRRRLGRRLLALLPEYVAAGQYLDAWLIQYFSWQTVEQPDRSNLFLFEMFDHGYQAWAAQIEEEQKAIIRELGFDPDHIRDSELSAEEILAQVGARVAEPEVKARMEAYYAEHKMMNAQADAEAWEMERSSVLLLEREDAASLYLTEEEMEPWIPLLEERLAPFQEQAEEAARQERTEDSPLIDVLGDALWRISTEMAAALFTPERVAQLVRDLEVYRNERIAAQEALAARYAQSALLSLQRREDPAESPLLRGLCFASLRALLHAASRQTPAGDEGQDAAEGEGGAD